MKQQWDVSVLKVIDGQQAVRKRKACIRTEILQLGDAVAVTLRLRERVLLLAWTPGSCADRLWQDVVRDHQA
jgi:hypothetical protein